VIVYGIERKDGKDAGRTACTVSPDVAALAKLRRRTAQRERQQTDRQRQQRRREPVRGV
jgi:hypothetical protein